MLILGIETTCDETAAAVVERSSGGEGRILSNIVLSQVSEHAAYGGVAPEIARSIHVSTPYWPCTSVRNVPTTTSVSSGCSA